MTAWCKLKQLIEQRTLKILLLRGVPRNEWWQEYFCCKFIKAATQLSTASQEADRTSPSSIICGQEMSRS